MKQIHTLKPQWILVILMLIGFKSGWGQVEYDCLQNAMQQQLLTDTGYARYLRELNTRLHEIANQQPPGNSTQTTPIYTIPVVVHVLHRNTESVGQGLNITYAQIQSQINKMNMGFAAQIPSSGPNAVDAGIKFCLANIPMGAPTWTNSSEPGVMRYSLTPSQQPILNHFFSLGGMNQLLSLTHPTASHFPYENYLNIWLIQSISDQNGPNIIGYSPRPILTFFPIDGIVFRSDCFGDNVTSPNNFPLNPALNAGTVLIHEAGHYLSLFHTWQGGCAGLNATDCANLGDAICDTPADTTLNTSACSPNNSCTDNVIPNSDPWDMIENFMDYSDDNCLNTFTYDQGQRMRALLTSLRSSLITPLNMALTGVAWPNGCLPPALLAAIQCSNAGPCINTAVNFSTPSIPGFPVLNYNWSFTGATPSNAATQTVNVTYTVTGVQTVIVTVTDPMSNVSVADTLFVVVSPCNPIQSANGLWYFGNLMGLNFSSGTGVPDYAAYNNGTIQSLEATTVVSDSLGQLIFYSDGDTVWDKNHQTAIPNLFGTMSESKSQIIAFKKPGSLNNYYLFHGTASEDYPGGLYYSELKDTLNTILPVSLNNMVPLPAGVFAISEKITAIPHCNGTDMWIIYNPVMYTNTNMQLMKQFYVNLVTANGITNASQSNAIPDIYTYPNNIVGMSNYGHMKASPDGKKIAVSTGWGPLIADFNNITGALTNFQFLTQTNWTSYAMSFSPDGKSLYYHSGLLGEISAITISPSIGQPVVIQPANVAFFDNVSLQLGPDSLLYIAHAQRKYLGRINNPNNIQQPGYVYNQVQFNLLPGLSCMYSLPNFVEARPISYPNPIISYNYLNCGQLQFNIQGCFDNPTYQWSFGNSTTSTLQNPIATYTATGAYTVTVNVLSNNVVVYTGTVVVYPIITTNPITGASVICAGNAAYSVPPGYNAYLWTVAGGATITTPNTNNSIQVNATGTFTLTCVQYVGTCVSTSVLTVTVNPRPVANAGADTLIACTGGSLNLGVSATSGTPPYTYSWSPPSAFIQSNVSNPVASSITAPFTAIATVIDANGCLSSDTVQIILSNAPAPVVTISSPPSICHNGSSLNLLPYGSPTGGNFFGNAVTANQFNPLLTGAGSFPIFYYYFDPVVGCGNTDTGFVNVLQCCTQVVSGVNTFDQQQSSSYGSSFAATPVPVRINGTFYVNNNFSIVNYNGANSVQLAPNATIVVQNGANLTIDNSMLQACGVGMWQGIIVEPSATITVINSSVIRDAIEAVTIQSGAPYTIIKSTLLNNYRNLIVEPYAGYHPGVFYFNHITGGVLTLSPYVGTRTLYGIEVTNVDSIIFGQTGIAQSTNNANTVFGVQVGMNLERSNVVNTNMLLNNIKRTTAPSPVPVCCSLNNCTNPAICNPPPTGTAIHQVAGRLWMRNNNGLPYEAVTFNDVNIGVKTEGAASLYVTGNTFQNLTNSNTPSIPSAGVWVLRDTLGVIIIDSNTVFNVVQGFVTQLTDHCTILIRENDIDKFVNGVRVLQQNKCGIKIGYNRFNAASNSNFGTNAIRLQTAVATSSTDSTQVYANTIYRCKTGVWLTSYKDAFVNESNSIWFGSATPATPEYGIRVQNSSNTTVDGNAIVRSGSNPNSDVVLRDNLYGISMQTGCQNSVVSNNGVMRLGTGIEFAWAGNFPATMSCNTMTWNMAGARFTSTFIGDQGSPVGNGVVHDNVWTFINIPNSQRTIHQSNSPTANWYSRNTQSSTMPTTFPSPSSQSPIQGYYSFLGAYPNATQTCATDCGGNISNCRQAKLADLALRNRPFDEMYEDELRAYDEQAFYEIMQDSSLLYKGTGYDAILQVYYDSLYTSATGQLSIAAYETSQGNNSNASQLVSASGGTSLMDDNRKQVYQIYLRSWALGILDFTPLDSAMLYNIALQHIKTGGTAVYDARVMLDLDVVDFDNGQARLATESVSSQINQSRVYPNPTSGEAVLEITLDDGQTGFVEVISITGQRLFSVPLNTGSNIAVLDLSGYAQGVYMYRVFVNEEFKEAGRIIRND
jgi:hypothetical protein